jgi:hypothetical protein
VTGLAGFAIASAIGGAMILRSGRLHIDPDEAALAIP